jgi:hypothetical protein
MIIFLLQEPPASGNPSLAGRKGFSFGIDIDSMERCLLCGRL